MQAVWICSLGLWPWGQIPYVVVLHRRVSRVVVLVEVWKLWLVLVECALLCSLELLFSRFFVMLSRDDGAFLLEI